jgi:hypothetical protein
MLVLTMKDKIIRFILEENEICSQRIINGSRMKINEVQVNTF